MAELLGAAGNKTVALLLFEYGGVKIIYGDYVAEVVAVAARALSVEKARVFLKSSVG